MTGTLLRNEDLEERSNQISVQIWNELLHNPSNYSGKWCVMGDFNCILNETEKRGGPKPQLSKILEFRECLDQCQLMDLGFAGHPFTWTNRRFGIFFICERLDRAVVNEEWCNFFPSAKLYHLSTSSSDHSPILLNTHDRDIRKPKIFRYEIAWSLHDDFINVVRNCWNEKGQDNHEPFYDVYNRFRNRVGIWKKIIFGDINRKIELIEHKLENAFFDIGRNY